jgi:hypothetical protein
MKHEHTLYSFTEHHKLGIDIQARLHPLKPSGYYMHHLL